MIDKITEKEYNELSEEANRFASDLINNGVRKEEERYDISEDYEAGARGEWATKYAYKLSKNG